MRPIYFHDETVKWLRESPNKPPTFYPDFDQVVKHNKKYEEINGASK